MFKTLFTLLLAIALPAYAAVTPPQAVQAQYELSMNGTPIAVMQETFEIRDGGYQAASETQAIGLFALVQRRPGRVTSSGDVGSSGLRPKTFDGTRGTGDARRVNAAFDWTAGTLTFTHDGRSETATLPPGTQDRLSVMYQFLFLDQAKLKGLAFAMTNGRKLDQYRYDIGPDTAIDTPLGRLTVIHLVKQHAAGETATEIWLAREHRLMPVKMRIVEDDGKRYEQVISRLEIR
ncbi:MAG: DUF3108 domain-containing protein [Burkholderiales bacterium]|jgi:hypothetical protein|nr:DUF3108 domain-containing protein [Burkholderiales bacterium]